VGILAFLFVAGCVAMLGVWLAKTMTGRAKPLLWAGIATAAVGAVMILAVVFLPRAAFGELGHGDGAGLMGLMLLGAVGMAVGLFLLLIVAVIFFVGHGRRNTLPKE
jgi:hypothetical protein